MRGSRRLAELMLPLTDALSTISRRAATAGARAARRGVLVMAGGRRAGRAGRAGGGRRVGGRVRVGGRTSPMRTLCPGELPSAHLCTWHSRIAARTRQRGHIP